MERRDKRKHAASLPLLEAKRCQTDVERNHRLELGDKCLCNRGAIPSGSMSVQSVKPEDVAVVSSPRLRCQPYSLDVDDACIHASESSVVTLFGDNHQSAASSDTSSTICSSNSLSDVTSNSCSVNARGRGCNGLLDLPLLEDKLVRLETCEPEFDEVKNRLVAGSSLLANDVKITGISKACYRSPWGQVRQQAFKQQEEVTRKLRGDTNVRYAWYGTTKQGISSVILHGFGQPKSPKDGAMFGAGIYLSPEKYSNLSAAFSDVDENGERHLVLCRVIMGRMEQICRGSVQFHPSSEDYDGGTNDLDNPKLYVVWPTHMNTHILPEYVVSFTLTATWQGIMTALRNGQLACRRDSQFKCGHTRPLKVNSDLTGDESTSGFSYSPARSPWMSIDLFLLLLKSNLSAKNMEALQQYYHDFKDGRLSGSDFMSNVRLIAGDHLVRSMRTRYMGAVLMQSLIVSGRYPMADNKSK